MTNEELDRARVDEAIRTGNGIVGSVALIAARLAREGWTPPVAVDPDLAEAEGLFNYWTEDTSIADLDIALAGIKRGRELERAEAKPGMVWVKHNWSEKCPVYKGAWVWIKEQRVTLILQAQYVNWRTVTHYAIITPPEDVA